MDKLYRYFSQNGEDYILCKFFKFKHTGYFVDIGAFDGIHLSNSYCFELLGWNGICVEPQNYYYKLCADNRPMTTCVRAACVHDEDAVDIIINKDATGLFSGVKLSNEQNNINDHYKAIGRDLGDHDQETVPAVTLDSLLSEHLPDECTIDFISIDVEGHEIQVLDGLNLSKFAPRILLVETGSGDNQSSISEYLNSHGYLFARRVGPNSFFANCQDDIDAINSIDVTCIIEKQMHPLGSEYTQSTFLNGKIIYREMNGTSMLSNYENLENIITERNQKVTYLLAEVDRLNNTLTHKIASLPDKIRRKYLKK